MKSLSLCLETGSEGDKHQLFGTRQARPRFGFTVENAELLPEQGNLEIFFSRRNADGREDIQNERDEAEQ